MSMRDYAIDDYGLVLDEEAMKMIISKLNADFLDEDTDLAYTHFSMKELLNI